MWRGAEEAQTDPALPAAGAAFVYLHSERARQLILLLAAGAVFFLRLLCQLRAAPLPRNAHHTGAPLPYNEM